MRQWWILGELVAASTDHPWEQVLWFKKCYRFLMLIWSFSSTFTVPGFVKSKYETGKEEMSKWTSGEALKSYFHFTLPYSLLWKRSLGLLKHICKSTCAQWGPATLGTKVSQEHEHNWLLIDPTGKAFPETSKGCRIVAIFLSLSFALDWWHCSKNTKFRFQAGQLFWASHHN